MPARTRKRKAKRRKPSSRKRTRRRRPASRPSVNTPSSDEDFVPHGDAEESSSASSDEEGTEQDEDGGEEESSGNEVQNSDVGLGSSAPRRRNASRAPTGVASTSSRRRRRQRPSKKDSSDEDFCLESEEELDDNWSAGNGVASTSSRRRRRHHRQKEDSSDEDFRLESEEEPDDNRFAGNSSHVGHAPAHSARPRRQGAREDSLDEDMHTGRDGRTRESAARRASRPARVRQRDRRQDSSDEDFDVDMERVSSNSGIANENTIATRAVTRAIDARLFSDLHLGTTGTIFPDSGELGHRDSIKNSDALQEVAMREGELSLQTSSPRHASVTALMEGDSVFKHTETDKRKGKEKVLEGDESAEISIRQSTVDDEAAAVVCGICLTEMVVADRGKLDCCDHFFCFGCIMEWAKVESRCPMCKQRFTTIGKSGTGVSKRTRTIRIPLRDQVYVAPEEQELPPEDPYADIVCMECHGTGDEGLLLLCDRCDSAAHTFCVGLGRSVPRGDWYCRDCQAFIGENSGSEDEAEELVLASDEEEEEYDDDYEDDERDSLLRSIVASINPTNRRARQASVQRRSTSTSRPPQPSRRVRSRLWRRLSRRRRRGRAAPAPRLSHAARALLSSSAAEASQTPRAEAAALQNSSARTVPQQRRLHERINEMRNNWGRIQNGDLQFDALRTGATRPSQTAAPIQPTVAPVLPTPSTTSALIIDRKDMEMAEQPESSSSKGNKGTDKDLQRAWQMMDHAQNLSAGIGSSRAQPHKPVASLALSSSGRVPPPTAGSATNNVVSVRKNLDPSLCRVGTPHSENGHGGTHNSGSIPPQVLSSSRLPAPSTLASLSGQSRKEEIPGSSHAKYSVSADTPPAYYVETPPSPSFPDNTSNGVQRKTMAQPLKPEPAKSSRSPESREDQGIAHPLTENPSETDKRGVSGAREAVRPRSSSLKRPYQEGLKLQLTELVKKQTWPVYLAERLDKEQFKQIARAAVYSLLASCDPNNKSAGLTCAHFEEQGTNPVVAKCCKRCLDQHVEKAVKTAKDKIIPS